jgi:hypothetical protein
MFNSGNSIDSFNKLPPTVALRSQDLFTFCGQTIVPTPALPSFFHPTALNPTASFEPVEQRVKRRYIEPQRPFRSLLD